eukprot:366388-Chlamydomonas_euryale.AAC.7
MAQSGKIACGFFVWKRIVWKGLHQTIMPACRCVSGYWCNRASQPVFIHHMEQQHTDAGCELLRHPVVLISTCEHARVQRSSNMRPAVQDKAQV